MRRLTNRFPDGIEIFEPSVGGRFIPDAPPDPLLGIQTWLIAGQVVQVETGMGVQEDRHLLAPMPNCPIDIQPNRVAAEPAIEMPEAQEEPGAIPLRGAHRAVAPQQRGHPPGQIEPLPVLAGRGDAQPLPRLGPPSAQARVECEPRFIQKGHGLVRAQRDEFFLTPAESGAPRWPGLAGTCDWPVSTDSRAGASTVEPAGLSGGSQSVA